MKSSLGPHGPQGPRKQRNLIENRLCRDAWSGWSAQIGNGVIATSTIATAALTRKHLCRPAMTGTAAKAVATTAAVESGGNVVAYRRAPSFAG
jgi:hypothetical protein